MGGFGSTGKASLSTMKFLYFLAERLSFPRSCGVTAWWDGLLSVDRTEEHGRCLYGIGFAL